MNRAFGLRTVAKSIASFEASMPTQRYSSASAPLFPPVPQPTSTTRASCDGGTSACSSVRTMLRRAANHQWRSSMRALFSVCSASMDGESIEESAAECHHTASGWAGALGLPHGILVAGRDVRPTDGAHVSGERGTG